MNLVNFVYSAILCIGLECGKGRIGDIIPIRIGKAEITLRCAEKFPARELSGNNDGNHI